MATNPFDDALSQLTGGPARTRKPRAPAQEVTTEPGAPSIFQRAGDAALGGLGAIANVIDLPGSMVRDVVHTVQSGTLHNPLDQLLTPFSDRNRTTGRDIGRAAGAMSSEDTTGNWFGQFGIEMALDPLTYLSLGANAVGKGGKVAKATGLIDDLTRVAAKKLSTPGAVRTAGSVGAREARIATTLDDLLQAATPAGRQAAQDYAAKTGIDLAAEGSKPIGGLAGIGLPFRDPSRLLGTGQTGQKIAKFLDDAGSAVKHFRVPGTQFQPLNAVSQLFDASLLGTQTREGQAAAKGLFDRQTASGSRAGKAAASFARQLDRAGLGTHGDADLVRSVLEGVASGSHLPKAARRAMHKSRQVLEALRKVSEEWGVGGKELEDAVVKYFPREMTEGVSLSAGKPGMPFTTLTGARKGRETYLKDIQGGTGTIKMMFKDAQVDALLKQGGNIKQVASLLESKYGGLMSKTFPVLDKFGKPILRNGVPLERNRFRRIATVMGKLPAEVRQTGLFGNHPVADFERHVRSALDSQAAGKTVLETLAQPGILKPSSGALVVPGSKTVKEVFKEAGIRAGDHTAGGLKKLWSLVSNNAPLPADPKAARKVLAPLLEWRVDENLAADLSRMNQAMTGPAAAGEIIGALDSFSNLWKAFQTGVWPKFHIRNLLSGQIQNWVAGLFSKGSLQDAHSFLRGGAVPGAAQIPEVQRLAAQRNMVNLTDDVATKLVGELAYAHKVVGRYGMDAPIGKIGEATPATIEGVLAGMPGQRPFSYRQIGKKAIGRAPGTNLLPWDVRGVGNRTESGFGPAAAGEDVGFLIEGLNRLAPWLNLLKQGWDAGAAAKKIGQTQVLYQNRNFTKFEQQTMARLLPFYKFAKGMLPWTLRELAENPGGKLANVIRAQHRAHSADELTPDYIADTASIPVSKAADGTRRYITGLGLMHEDPLSLFGGGPQGMALEAISRLNPALKAPLEFATGETFFQRGPNGGRDLEDLDPQLGRILANVTGRESAVKFPGSQAIELLLGNSPVSSLLTQIRTATDPRKGLPVKLTNLGTGVRVSDVSPGAQDAILRQAVQQMEKQLGAKKYVKTYFPEAEKAQLSPHDRAIVEQLLQTETLLRERSKARKAAKESTK